MLGYFIGLVGYLLLKQSWVYVYQALLLLLGNNEFILANLAGLAMSFITLGVVIAWSRLSS